MTEEKRVVCPFCGGQLRELVAVFYFRLISPDTVAVQKKGKRINEEVQNIHCSVCGAMHDHIANGFVRPKTPFKRQPQPPTEEGKENG